MNKKIFIILGILLVISLAVLTWAYCRWNRTYISISGVQDAMHIAIRSGGKDIFSKSGAMGYWQICSAETDSGRLTLKISPLKMNEPQKTYELPQIKEKLIDLRGNGEKRFLVIANVISPEIPERAVFYFFDCKDNFAFYGTREYFGELGASFVLPNEDLTFNTYAETGYWENSGGSFITVQNRLARGGNRYISGGKADFKQLYLKYRSIKQHLEKRGGDRKTMPKLIMFTIFSDLFTYDNGAVFARRFAAGLGYGKAEIEANLTEFIEKIKTLKEADAIRSFNPDFSPLH